MLIVVALVVLVLMLVMSRQRRNSGVLEERISRSGDVESSTTIAYVLGAAARLLSAERGCRVEISTVSAVRVDPTSGGADYSADCMLTNVCTAVLTYERVAVELRGDRVALASARAVAPVPVDTGDGVTTELVEQDADAPTGMSLPSAADARHVRVPDNRLGDVLDYSVLSTLSTEPLQDLVDALADKRNVQLMMTA